MADETEYAFWHVLVRDVAYAALPRAARASRHVAAAGWIEERAGDRVEDLADVLAHHYSTALDLARAVGDDAGAAAVEPLALRFLLMAGERAVELDVESALAVLERALALAPAGHPERPAALRRYGQALGASGRSNEAVLAYEEAIEGFRAVDDGAATAGVLGRLSSTWRDLDDARGWTSAWEEVEQLERLGPSWQLTRGAL